QGAIAEARAVQLDEQIAAAREQCSPAPGTHLGMEEQSADLRRTFEVGGQAQHLVAEGLAELGAGLGQRADVIGIEGLDDSDLPEDLAGAADLVPLGVLQHEHIEVGGLAVVAPLEALVGAIELGDQRAAIGGQVGEAATGELRHLVDGAEIVSGCGADPEAHAASAASRRMVSALRAARSARLSTIRNSSMLWILPPRTPIVSTTATPQAAMLLPSQTPPEGCHAISCPRSAPACLTRLKRASARGVSGLGGRAKPPFTSIRTSRSAATAAMASSIARLASASISGVRGRRFTRSTARSGTTLLGLPPSIRDGLTVSPSRFSASSRSARSAAASSALRPSSGLRPAWADLPRTTIPKLPLPGRAPASVPSGSAAGS